MIGWKFRSKSLAKMSGNLLSAERPREARNSQRRSKPNAVYASGLSLLFPDRSRFEYGIGLKRQLNWSSAFRRLVNAQNDLDGPSSFVTVDCRRAVLFHCF